MDPFLALLVENIGHRFPQMGSLSAFAVLDPKTILESRDPEHGRDQMKSLAESFPRLKKEALLNDWDTFMERAKLPDLKVCRNLRK